MNRLNCSNKDDNKTHAGKEKVQFVCYFLQSHDSQRKGLFKNRPSSFLPVRYVLKQLIKISPLCMPGFMKNVSKFGQSQAGTPQGGLE